MRHPITHIAAAVGLLASTLGIANCSQSANFAEMDSGARIDMRTTGTVPGAAPEAEPSAKTYPSAPVFMAYGI